eukprot:m.22011 g.22011  ORF g.22011 m.22011 type:complete len:58 (+) comp12583_c0_seq4:1837-2010(+)
MLRFFTIEDELGMRRWTQDTIAYVRELCVGFAWQEIYMTHIVCPVSNVVEAREWRRT